VFLPRERRPAPPTSAPDDLPTGTGRLLLVDDEPSLTLLEKRLLEELGYQVAAFNSSVDALDRLEEDPDAFDLVITDLTMPRLTGLALANEIHELRPDLPILLLTGLQRRHHARRGPRAGIRQVLLKPLPPHELAQAVAAVLQASR